MWYLMSLNIKNNFQKKKKHTTIFMTGEFNH